MYKTNIPKFQPNIEMVINARLKLQSTQTKLNRDFGLYSLSSLSDMKSLKFCNEYLEMEEAKRKEFRSLIGGVVNDHLTYKLMAGLMSNYGLAIQSESQDLPVETLEQSLFKISKETGLTFNTVSKIARQLSKRGLSSDAVITKARDVAVLCKLAGMDYDKALRAIYAAEESFV